MLVTGDGSDRLSRTIGGMDRLVAQSVFEMPSSAQARIVKARTIVGGGGWRFDS
jgi:hypothetical protein